MKRVRVVAGLFCRGSTVLAQQRPAHKARGLLWEFPGGKVEAGETDAQALIRECVEELGVEVTVGAKLWESVHAYDDLEVELVLLAASMDQSAVPRPHEAQQLAWVERPTLAGMAFCEADLPLLPRLATGEL